MDLKANDSKILKSEDSLLSFSKNSFADLLRFIKSPAVVFSKQFKVLASNNLFKILNNQKDIIIGSKLSKFFSDEEWKQFNVTLNDLVNNKSGKENFYIERDIEYKLVLQNLGDSENNYIAIFETFIYKGNAELQFKQSSKKDNNTQLDNIKLLDLFSIEELQKLQDAFCDAVGIASLISDVDGTPITEPGNFTHLCFNIVRKTETGLKNCLYSDACLGRPNTKGAIVSPCYSSGLYDGGASIMVGNKHLGNWLIGQVRTPDQGIEELANYANVIGVNKDEYIEALKKVPVMDKEMFENIGNLLYIIANQLSNHAFENIQKTQIMKENAKIHKAMIESEQRFRTLVENAPEAIVVYDIDNQKLVDANAKAANLFELKLRDLLDLRLKDLSPDILPTGELASLKFMQYLNDAANGNTPTFKWWCLNSNKKLIPCEISLTKLPHKNKRIIRGSIVDITEREKSENKIRLLNIELEKKIDDRSKELISINKELDNFAYIVSHDLKAPLRGINQLAEWIKIDNEDKLDEEGLTNLDLLMDRVGKMNSLIEGVLEYSRVSKVSSELHCVDLNIVVDDVVELLGIPDNVEINKKGILPKVYGEKLKLEQVFQNIISNSINYSDKDLCVIDIFLSEDNKHFNINIKDNGPGIDEKYHEKIFEIFQSISNQKDSTGIGLSIVKKVMKTYNGSVSVTSPVEPNNDGTKFILSFPKQQV